MNCKLSLFGVLVILVFSGQVFGCPEELADKLVNLIKAVNGSQFQLQDFEVCKSVEECSTVSSNVSYDFASKIVLKNMVLSVARPFQLQQFFEVTKMPVPPPGQTPRVEEKPLATRIVKVDTAESFILNGSMEFTMNATEDVYIFNFSSFINEGSVSYGLNCYLNESELRSAFLSPSTVSRRFHWTNEVQECHQLSVSGDICTKLKSLLDNGVMGLTHKRMERILGRITLLLNPNLQFMLAAKNVTSVDEYMDRFS